MKPTRFVKGPLHVGSLTACHDSGEDFESAAIGDEDGLIHGEGHGTSAGEALANAALFAAAPDLYAALDRLCFQIREGLIPDTLDARNALSKARGES